MVHRLRNPAANVFTEIKKCFKIFFRATEPASTYEVFPFNKPCNFACPTFVCKHVWAVRGNNFASDGYITNLLWSSEPPKSWMQWMQKRLLNAMNAKATPECNECKSDSWMQWMQKRLLNAMNAKATGNQPLFPLWGYNIKNLRVSCTAIITYPKIAVLSTELQRI